jgi:hypothetical protein
MGTFVALNLRLCPGKARKSAVYARRRDFRRACYSASFFIDTMKSIWIFLRAVNRENIMGTLIRAFSEFT